MFVFLAKSIDKHLFAYYTIQQDRTNVHEMKEYYVAADTRGNEV